jgi:cutinase
MCLRLIGRVFIAALVILGGLLSAAMPVTSAQPCPDVEAVFARGTGEPPGVGGIGEPFVDALRGAVGPKSLDVYPVKDRKSVV